MPYFIFFFNDTATAEIYTLSLHDALPISSATTPHVLGPSCSSSRGPSRRRSEEHTSELQSLAYLVCRLLLEKKKKQRSRATRRGNQGRPRSAEPPRTALESNLLSVRFIDA